MPFDGAGLCLEPRRLARTQGARRGDDVTTLAANRAEERYFPEVAAGGLAAADGTVNFYAHVHSLLEEGATVLDFGAGRGRSAEDANEWRSAMQDLRAPGRRVIGVDVDDAVLENPQVDEAHVLAADGRIPVADGSIDLLLADWVFEHISDPRAAIAEFGRVLRPGGWLCARTPNKYGYIALGSRLIPDRLHAALVGRLQPGSGREDHDVFPTVYRMNSTRQLQELFTPDQWSAMWCPTSVPPAYAGSSSLLYRLQYVPSMRAPSALRPVLLVYARRRFT